MGKSIYKLTNLPIYQLFPPSAILPRVQGGSMKRTLSSAALVSVLLTAAGAGVVAQRGGASAPALQVNPLWPEPLPNHWVLGSVTGVSVDARDHVWVAHRGADSLEGG